MRIYAICGLIGSGKDTLSGILQENFEKRHINVVKLSFAKTLKDAVSCVFGWDRKMLEGDTKESREWRETVDEWWSKRLNIPNLTPRFILQNWGTDVLRGHFHPDIWIASLESQIRFSGAEVVIITDCRFQNEIECLKKYNTKFIWIQRGDLPKWVDMYLEYDVEPKNIHPSEYSWIKNSFDYIIHNDRDINSLSLEVEKMI